MPRVYTRRPLWDRLWEKVDFFGDCWVWQASVTRHGYGRIGLPGGRWRFAHRVAYELLVGVIPASAELDHLCKNPPCVNPDHLEPVTHAVNNARSGSLSARRARQTHCKRGHAFTPANTYSTGDGRRYCRTCRSEYERTRVRRRAA